MITRSSQPIGPKEVNSKPSSAFLGLEASVNDSAKSMSLLWISFILFCSYLVVATSALTPSSLFFGSGVQIPIVSISVGIEVFSIVSPLLVCLFGIYIYVQLAGFTNKAQLYVASLSSEYPKAPERERKRRSLDLFPLLQLIAGAASPRAYTFLLLGIIWVSLFFLPTSLFLILLVKTLPFHSEFVTWSIRTSSMVLSISFLALLFCILATLDLSRWLIICAGTPSILISVAAAIFSCLVAIFPGEAIYQNRVSEGLVFPVAGGKPLYKTLFEGEFDLAKAARKSLFTNTLVVTPTAEFQDSVAKLGAVFVRGRDFRLAAFVDLNLKRADFSGSMLSGALFYRTDLREARFDCLSSIDPALYSNINLDRPAPWPDGCSWLHGAAFQLSTLQGASFYGARARWTWFIESYLQGAYFTNANMQAAQFGFSDLTGANFQQTRLSGSSFTWCSLSGVNFSEAWMTGVHIGGCSMEGILMLDTHARGLALEDQVPLISKSALAPIVRDDDIFDKKDGEDYKYWKARIREDKPQDGISPSWHIDRTNALDALSVDVAVSVDKEEAYWKSLPSYIAYDRPLEAHSDAVVDAYSDAVVDIACSSNGSPYVARSLFAYNRALTNLSEDTSIFNVMNGIRPHLYKAIDRVRSENRSCPGLREITDVWPLRSFFPWIDTISTSTKRGEPKTTTNGKGKKSVTKG